MRKGLEYRGYNLNPIQTTARLMNQQPDDTANDDEELYQGPSKSQRKRDMEALQKLGEDLVQLSPDQLSRVPLPDNVVAAVKDWRRFTKHEAKRRQMQYIGRLMRDVEPEPVRAALEAFKGTSRAETARFQRLERLRDDFLEDEQVAGRIVEAWPAADLQHLRTLRRNALREREQNKPPRAYRELFRMLRELDEAALAAEATAQAEDPTENA